MPVGHGGIEGRKRRIAQIFYPTINKRYRAPHAWTSHSQCSPTKRSSSKLAFLFCRSLSEPFLGFSPPIWTGRQTTPSTYREQTSRRSLIVLGKLAEPDVLFLRSDKKLGEVQKSAIFFLHGGRRMKKQDRSSSIRN